jgi:hypothetical protein
MMARFGMADRHIHDKGERNTGPPLVAVPGPCCMYAHTYRKEIYGFWSLEKRVKLQGKKEEEE